MSTLVGYARVSTHEQDTAAQERALRDAGAARVFVDHAASSRRADRPQWIACLDYLRAGDTLLVWRLDRLAGTQTLAIATINDLHERGVQIKSLTEPDIDTTSPMSATLENEADATFENEATGSCCLVCRVLGLDAGQGVDPAVA